MKEEIKKAIARICLRSEDGDIWTLGTGFLVKENYILTALHVIAKKDPLPIVPFVRDFSIIFYTLENNQLIINYETTATLTNYYDHLSDWAILECNPIPENKNIKPISLISSKSFQLNQIDKKSWVTYGFATGVKLEGMTYSGNITDPIGHDDNIAAIQLYCNEVGAANGMLVNGLSGSPCIIDDIAVGILRSQLVKDNTYNQCFSKLVSLFFDKNKNQDKENEYKNILDFLSKKQQQISPIGATLWACPTTNVVNHTTFSNKLYALSKSSTKIYIQPPGTPYKSEWYVHQLEKEQEEAIFNSLVQPGSAVAVYAPSSFGKTTFLDYIVDTIEKGNLILSENNFLKSTIAKLNLAIDTRNEDENTFFNSFAYKIAKELSMDTKDVDKVWSSSNSPQSNLENFILQILKKEKNTFVLVIDNADEVWKHSYSNSFLGLLHSWLNNANRKNWENLRLILAISLPPNKLVTDIRQSVFKTPPIKLQELNKNQIEELAILHRLEWKEEEITQLMQKVGGHPYLARIVMYKAYSDPMNKDNPKGTLTRLLDHTKPQNEIFDNYLHNYETWLRKEKDICDEFLHFSDGTVKRPRSQDPVIIDSLVKSGLLIESESDFGLFSLRYKLFKRLSLKLTP